MRKNAKFADALSARTSPANSLSRVVRRSEPRTTRGFLLWAPDYGLPPQPSEVVSNPVCLKTS